MGCRGKYSILYYWQHGSAGPASKKPKPKVTPIYKKPQTADADPYIQLYNFSDQMPSTGRGRQIVDRVRVKVSLRR